jgi:hypothetical protein
MSTQDIVKNSDWVKKYHWDWKVLYASIYHAQETLNNYRILRDGNTLFVYEIVSPGVCKLNVINADPDNVFKKNVINALKALKVAGFHEVIASSKNVMQLNAVRRAGFKIDVSPGPKDDDGNSTFIGVIHV